MKNNIIVGTLLALIMTACSTPKDVTYMQDVQNGTIIATAPSTAIKARPDDRLQIVVSSKDPALAALFNLSQPTTGTTSNNRDLYFSVDAKGDIQYPLIGPIHVAGMTRAEIAEYIRQLLVDRNLCRDATVTVEFANAGVNILGEVKNPGRYSLAHDRVTLLEGIALAGDLTIQGERHNVSVIREEIDGSQHVYRIDLTNAESLYGSPAYYLQQNDVVYIEPNDTRKRQRSVNGNSVYTPSFWISIASFLATVAVLIWN